MATELIEFKPWKQRYNINNRFRDNLFDIGKKQKDYPMDNGWGSISNIIRSVGGNIGAALIGRKSRDIYDNAYATANERLKQVLARKGSQGYKDLLVSEALNDAYPELYQKFFLDEYSNVLSAEAAAEKRRQELADAERDRGWAVEDRDFVREGQIDDRNFVREGQIEDRDFARSGVVDDRNFAREGVVEDRNFAREGVVEDRDLAREAVIEDRDIARENELDDLFLNRKWADEDYQRNRDDTLDDKYLDRQWSVEDQNNERSQTLDDKYLDRKWDIEDIEDQQKHEMDLALLKDKKVQGVTKFGSNAQAFYQQANPGESLPEDWIFNPETGEPRGVIFKPDGTAIPFKEDAPTGKEFDAKEAAKPKNIIQGRAKLVQKAISIDDQIDRALFAIEDATTGKVFYRNPKSFIAHALAELGMPIAEITSLEAKGAEAMMQALGNQLITPFRQEEAAQGLKQSIFTDSDARIAIDDLTTLDWENLTSEQIKDSLNRVFDKFQTNLDSSILRWKIDNNPQSDTKNQRRLYAWGVPLKAYDITPLTETSDPVSEIMDKLEDLQRDSGMPKWSVRELRAIERAIRRTVAFRPASERVRDPLNEVEEFDEFE